MSSGMSVGTPPGVALSGSTLLSPQATADSILGLDTPVLLSWAREAAGPMYDVDPALGEQFGESVNDLQRAVNNEVDNGEPIDVDAAKMALANVVRGFGEQGNWDNVVDQAGWSKGSSVFGSAEDVWERARGGRVLQPAETSLTEVPAGLLRSEHESGVGFVDANVSDIGSALNVRAMLNQFLSRIEPRYAFALRLRLGLPLGENGISTTGFARKDIQEIMMISHARPRQLEDKALSQLRMVFYRAGIKSDLVGRLFDALRISHDNLSDAQTRMISAARAFMEADRRDKRRVLLSKYLVQIGVPANQAQLVYRVYENNPDLPLPTYIALLGHDEYREHVIIPAIMSKPMDAVKTFLTDPQLRGFLIKAIEARSEGDPTIGKFLAGIPSERWDRFLVEYLNGGFPLDSAIYNDAHGRIPAGGDPVSFMKALKRRVAEISSGRHFTLDTDNAVDVWASRVYFDLRSRRVGQGMMPRSDGGTFNMLLGELRERGIRYYTLNLNMIPIRHVRWRSVISSIDLNSVTFNQLIQIHERAMWFGSTRLSEIARRPGGLLSLIDETP